VVSFHCRKSNVLSECFPFKCLSIHLVFQCFRDYLRLNMHQAIKSTGTVVVKLQAFLSSSLHEGKLSDPDLPAKRLYGN